MRIYHFFTAACCMLGLMSVQVQAQTVLLSMKGPGADNPFWAALEQGARNMAMELGVQIVVSAPPQESDNATQIQQIENEIAKGVDAIVIAPTDPRALAPTIDQAVKAGIQVVFVETRGVNKGVTFIGTDNTEGAALAADFICDNVEHGSDVAILQGIMTQSTARARARSVRQRLNGCGLNIVAEQPADWDSAKAQAVTKHILNTNPYIKAIFASNDNMALGAVEALKSANMLQQVMVVGFDANPNAVTAVLAGDMAATVAQNPKYIGTVGVESILKLLNGQTIPEIIDTGTVLVTKENAADYQ